MSHPPSGVRDGAGTRGSTDLKKAIPLMPGRWIAKTPQRKVSGSLQMPRDCFCATAFPRIVLVRRLQPNALVWAVAPLGVR
jgi:hypothetical protein